MDLVLDLDLLEEFGEAVGLDDVVAESVRG